MEKYKNVLQRRVIWYVLFLLLFVGGMVGSFFMPKIAGLPDFMRGFADGFQFGLFLAMAVFIAVTLARTLGALRSEDKLKKLYICETDERNRLISYKVGGLPYTFFYFMLIFACTAALSFNLTVFYTLLGVTFCLGVFRLGLKLYYGRAL